MSGYLNIRYGGTDRKVGFDLTNMYRTLDIFTYHTYRRDDWRPHNRLLDSLQKAYPGTGTGVLEWSAAMARNSQLFDEDCYLANGLGMLSVSMAWGQTLHDMWYGTGVGAESGANWPEPRLGNCVLRSHSAFIPLMMARLRQMGRPALEHPTIPPDVALLEVTSSFYNAYPQDLYYLSPRRWMDMICPQLEPAGYNYGFLHERPLLEGRQSLEGIQTVIVPLGFCCPPELAELLLAWTGKGGNLVLLGPAGMDDQYGKPDNRLLRAALGYSGWTRGDGYVWQPEGAGTPAINQELRIYQGAHGQGRVTLMSDLSGAFPMDALMEAVAERTAPTVRCDNRDFVVVVREAPDAYYLYAVNANARPLEGPGEAEITLRRPIVAAADMGLPTPVAVPTVQRGEETSFRLRLDRGEATVVRLTKP